MTEKKRKGLVVGMVALLVGMGFVITPMNTLANGTQAPTVTKSVSPTDICFGTIESTTTVTIEVTGAGDTTSTPVPMDVVFAIDSSGSMQTTDPDDARLDAAKDFVDMMSSSDDQGGVVSWDNDIDFTYGLSDDFTELKSKIDDVDSSGGTDLDIGLEEAIDMLDGDTTSGVIKAIIFLTDGIDDYTYSGDPGSFADEAAGKGYKIFSIGLSSYVDEDPLIDMADATGGSYFYSASSSNLQTIYNSIFTQIVTSTFPHFVKVIEVTESYIVNHDNFNIAPDSVTTNSDDTTTIVWENIGQYVGDYDDALDGSETVTLTFTVGANKPGYALDVEVDGAAKVEYSDSEGTYVGSVPIPQATINVCYSTDLIADGGDEYLDVGDVIISQDASNLYVKFVTTGGWEMTETHLHVADSLAGIPHTKKGNPKVGKFTENDAHDPPVQEYEYTIPWTWSSGATLYIAAHAVVQKEIGVLECEPSVPIYRIETAWGEGEDFGGASWAMYILYEDP